MKRCKVCDTEKPFSEFNKKGDGYQSRCRECQKVWYKNYYETNDKEKARLKANRIADYAKKRQVIVEAKNKPCMDCGKSYPAYVMDFDHRDPKQKQFNISAQLSLCNVDKLQAEIAKCDVVCANCHRVRTWQEA